MSRWEGSEKGKEKIIRKESLKVWWYREEKNVPGFFFCRISLTFPDRVSVLPYLMKIISSSNTDIPNTLSLLLPIVHCFWQVHRAISRFLTELLYVGSSWSSCFFSAIWGGRYDYITYELVPAMSGSSNFDSFRDGR